MSGGLAIFLKHSLWGGGGGGGEWGEVVLLQHHTIISCYIWLIVVKVQESPIIVFRTRSKA